MNTQHDSIDLGDAPSAQGPTYSAPRLQRLGRVSEVTEINANNSYDGSGYAS